MSGGEQQRVALTRARVIARRVLALDEPTANLDRHSRQQTYELIGRLRDEGTAIVIASHDIAPLTAVADLHFHLQAGRLMTPGKVAAETVKDNVTLFPGGRS